MSLENKSVTKFNIKDYQELIDTLAKVEYKKLCRTIVYKSLESLTLDTINN